MYLFSRALPVGVKPAAPPAAASPPGWHSDNPLPTVEDASLGQSGCTALSKTCLNHLLFIWIAYKTV